MTARGGASPDAAVPLIEHIRAIADVLSLQGEHYDEVSRLLTRLERELLPHELVSDGQLNSPNVHNAHDLSSSPLSLRIHAEIELQVLGLRALVQGLGSDVAHVRELKGRLYGLGAAVRLYRARADFEGQVTLPAIMSDQR